MLIDNRDPSLKSVIAKEWDKADEIIISSPFISGTDILTKLLSSKKKVTLIFRLTYPAPPDLIDLMLEISDRRKKLYYYDDVSLHAKIYLFKKDGKCVKGIIGSSNFTYAGLSKNKEFNIATTKELESIEEYLNYLIKESEGLLSEAVAKSYRKTYKAPEMAIRYKETSLSKKRVAEYENVLERFQLVKGVLEEKNTSKLPFTYLWDGFVHELKDKIIKEYDFKVGTSFNRKALEKAFDIYLKHYLKQGDIDFRVGRGLVAKEIRQNIVKVKREVIEDFLLSIHSIHYGSGSGNRKRAVREAETDELRELLSFIVNSDLPMPQKYALALTDRENKGYRIPYLGPSSIGEMPGWLEPDNYPIKNDKMLFALDYFNV